MKDQIFTHSEVCGILCEGCWYQIPDVREHNRFFHYLNGERIVCRASFFRDKVARCSEIKEAYQESSWEKS